MIGRFHWLGGLYRHVGFVLALSIANVCVISTVSAQSLDNSVRTVARFQDGLIAVMRDGNKLGFDGRRMRLGELLKAEFDVEFIVDVLLGSGIKTLTKEDRSQLKAAVFGYAAAALAGAFTTYAGERFVTGRVSRLRSGKSRVRSDFFEGNGRRYKVNLVLRSQAGRWRIVDLWFDGISGVRIYQAEFRSVLARSSAQDLVAELQRRTRTLESSEPNN